MAGRPTIYTEELAATICERIANGESVRNICRDQLMPNRSTVNLWLTNNESFLDQYVKAKTVQADDAFDEIRALARTALDNPSLAHAVKVVIDADKWCLSKMLPKKYGDKTSIEHSGGIGLRGLTDEELDKRIAALESSTKN